MFTIHNQGLREIQFADGAVDKVLKPKAYMKVSEKVAEFLDSMFKGEITIIEKIAEEAEAIAAVETEETEKPKKKSKKIAEEAEALIDG